MHRQLDLWPDPYKAPQAPDIWESLDQQEQARLIAVLARLISKAVHPPNIKETREEKHDR